MPDVVTLSIDIGGSGFKACLLDTGGQMLGDRVRVDTPYPCPPDRFVATVGSLTDPLRPANRASVGFPGMVRRGHVLHVPSLSRAAYGGPPDPGLTAAWTGFDAQTELSARLSLPTKVVNDADMQGCAVVSGVGMEFVMTLGTGVGTALFHDGRLLPHLELSHGPYNDDLTVDLALGNAARKEIGHHRWVKRVRKAIALFDDMLWFDHIYVGGGNAKHLAPADTGSKGSIVSNTAGLVGGVRVWELHQEEPGRQ
ncbi:MAG: ROK family protein [Actinomycetales bacterium]|nr:ROK family protein [Actinomycetales bacterium]